MAVTVYIKADPAINLTGCKKVNDQSDPDDYSEVNSSFFDAPYLHEIRIVKPSKGGKAQMPA